jgi:DNA-binding transcriptional regulator LsrR (DeoR family)
MSRRGDDRTDLQEQMVAAAVLYYQQDRSQDQIAHALGVSRPTVSRLLARARDTGIVRIEIVPPSVDPGLPARLAAELGIAAVHIAPGRAESADPGPVLSAGLEAALQETGLAAGDVLVVSWGRAVYSASGAVLRPRPGVVVAPALGGNDSDRPWFQPNEVARRWAATLEGTPRYLHAPAFVSRGLFESLVAEPAIRDTLALWDKAHVAVLGVGGWPKPDASYAAAGFPTDDPALVDAAGDVAGRSFRIDGSPVEYEDPRRFLAISADELRRIPHRIGLAAGVDKAGGVVGAARAGLINVLVTDAVTARAVRERLALR